MHDFILTIGIVSLPMCHSSSYEMYTFLLQTNTFQVVVAADVQMTFVFFIYGDIQWGDGANIGFNAGENMHQGKDLHCDCLSTFSTFITPH